MRSPRQDNLTFRIVTVPNAFAEGWLQLWFNGVEVECLSHLKQVTCIYLHFRC